MPAWIDFNDRPWLPNLDNRDFKVAIDAYGPQSDPDTGDRIVAPASLTAVRAYLARRMPASAKAAIDCDSPLPI